MLAVDLIIDARWVLPIEPAQAVLRDCSLVVDHGRMVALAPSASVRQSYQGRTHLIRDRHVRLPAAARQWQARMATRSTA